MELLDEVRGFLDGLKADLPDLFLPPRPARRAPRGELFARAETVLAERAAHWSSLMGLTYGRLRVKDQRTLWGSCSREGHLNFNWRLVLAPPEVLDYVVVHELAHRLELN